MPGSNYIGCSQQIGKTIQKVFIVPTGAIAEDNGFGTMLLNNLLVFGYNTSQSFIPRDALPFASPLARSSLERIDNPVRMIHQLLEG
jgi:hypothetical protein